MSILSRLLGFEARGAASGNPLDDRYYGPGPVGYATGGRVSPELALKIGTVYRCVSIIAGLMGVFPKGVYEELDPGRRRAREQPMDFKLRLQPNPWQTSFEFYRQIYVALLLRQNAFVQMVQLGAGAMDLVPLHPDRVRGPELTRSGMLRYEYTASDGTRHPLLGGVDLWHLKGLSEDGLRGLSLMDLASGTISLAAAAERHASRFFERGVKFAGILEHESKLKPDTAREMSESFSRTYGGEPGAGKTPVLWEGMKFKPVTMSNKDAEFLDSRKFSVNDIARWFGVPPHMVGDVEKSTSWGTGIEEQNLGFLIYSMLPWVTLLEQSARLTLLINPERYYLKCNTSVLLRMSAKDQMDVFQIAILNGILNPNECRELLELNPREGGDVYLSPLNMRQGAGAPQGGGSAATDAHMARASAIAERLAEEADRLPAAPAAAAVEGHRARVRWIAGQILTREADELRGLSAKAGGSTERWQHAVASFYGRHAPFVSEALSIPLDRARAYCRGQQETLSAREMASAESWAASHIDRLAGMVAEEVSP